MNEQEIQKKNTEENRVQEKKNIKPHTTPLAREKVYFDQNRIKKNYANTNSPNTL